MTTHLPSPITTHVLDLARGRPAAGLPVELLHEERVIGSGHTDADGRLRDLLPASARLAAGRYRLVFTTGPYLEAASGDRAFFPRVAIDFEIDGAAEHYHVPLLLSPFGYTTYRGS